MSKELPDWFDRQYVTATVNRYIEENLFSIGARGVGTRLNLGLTTPFEALTELVLIEASDITKEASNVN